VSISISINLKFPMKELSELSTIMDLPVKMDQVDWKYIRMVGELFATLNSMLRVPRLFASKWDTMKDKLLEILEKMESAKTSRVKTTAETLIKLLPEKTWNVWEMKLNSLIVEVPKIPLVATMNRMSSFNVLEKMEMPPECHRKKDKTCYLYLLNLEDYLSPLLFK